MTLPLSRAGLLASLLALFLLAGCTAVDRVAAGGRGEVRPYTEAEFGTPDPVAPLAMPTEYRIGALDLLTVTVFQIEDMSGDRTVDQQGNIQLPLVGIVPAQGLTATQLADALEKRLGEKYLQSPQVEVVVKEALGQRVTVDGSVRAPGMYALRGSTSLLQVIALAKGMDETAIPSRVAVFRTVKGKRMAAAFDVNRIRKGQQPDPQIYGNDIVVVDGSNTRANYRDILRSIPLLAVFGVI